jgi:chemotaxis protein histidine kinase CheA
MADDDLARELEALSVEYRASLGQRLIDIDAAWGVLRRGEGGLAEVRTVLRNLHSMAGSALTFGMPELGAAAAAAEDWIDPYDERGELPPSSAHDAFEPLLAVVRQTAAG